MKTDIKLRKHERLFPIGFGWYTGSKSSVKKMIKLPIRNTDNIYYI